MTNGEPVVVRAAMKPIPTQSRPLRTVTVDRFEATTAHRERSDVCAVPAASPYLPASAYAAARVSNTEGSRPPANWFNPSANPTARTPSRGKSTEIESAIVIAETGAIVSVFP